MAGSLRASSSLRPFVAVLMIAAGALGGVPLARSLVAAAEGEAAAAEIDGAAALGFDAYLVEGAADDACCAAHPGVGCADAVVVSCVCAKDPFCCAGEWDEACVAAIAAQGCGPACGDPGDGACCLERGAPGCADAAVAACVCAEEPYCCEEMWDERCVAAIERTGCGHCE